MQQLHHRHRAGAGFTLVECAVVCTVVGILASVAIPSYQGRELRVARLDAVAALTRVQIEQEKYRALHGLYATDIAVLRGVHATSAQGRYTLRLDGSGPDAYRATASAQGKQAGDRSCPALTLDVAQGFPHAGPSAACWNR